MRLDNNSPAPLFSKPDLNENVFELGTPRKKPLLLAFFRYASCPLCNLRVQELIKNYQELKDVLDIVAVFQSPPDKIKQYVGKQAIPFLVIPDPEKTLYQLYGVENSWLGFGKAWTVKISQVFNAVVKHKFIPGSVEGEINRIPADFIIGSDNILIKAYYGNDIGDHLPLADILTLVTPKQHETRQ